MSQEEQLFTLMIHAEDLQRAAKNSLQEVHRATEHLEKNTGEAITASIQVGIEKTLADIQKGLQGASRGLVEASDETKATCSLLKRTGLLQVVFQVIGAVIIIGVFYLVSQWLFASRVSELAELKTQVKQERKTLDALESKTWGLELVDYNNGTRGIILPKGVKIDRTGTVPDGRKAIVIKP